MQPSRITTPRPLLTATQFVAIDSIKTRQRIKRKQLAIQSLRFVGTYRINLRDFGTHGQRLTLLASTTALGLVDIQFISIDLAVQRRSLDS